MADLHLFRHTVLVAVLIVVGLQILIRNGRRRRDFRAIDDDVLNLPLLGDGVVVGSLIAFIKRLQLFIGRVQSLQDVGLRDHGIFEFHLCVAAVEFVANFGVPHEGAA